MPDSKDRARPTRPIVASKWLAPFQWTEWVLEWLVFWFRGIALFEFLEYAGKLTILFGVLVYFYEIPERRRKALDERKRAQYEAWLIVNSARNEGGDGGRRLAIRDLHEDGVSLLGLPAEEAFLDGLDLSRSDLRRAHFRWADLKNTQLVGSNLKNADLRNADLRNANLKDASLVGADLRNARFQGAELSGADLSEADVTGAIFQGSKGLDPSMLRVASHYDAAILDSNFGRAEGFDAMDLSGLNLAKCDFRYADLAGRRLENATLEACNFNGIDLAGANLKGANLSYASMRGTNLSGAKLQKAILSSLNQPLPAYLSSKTGPADIVTPAAQGPPPSLSTRDPRSADGGRKVTNFRGAELQGAILDNANLEDADLSEANLAGTMLYSANLRGASLRNANLDGAKLEYCLNLTESQLKLAKNWEKATYPLPLEVQLGRRPARDLGPTIDNSTVPSKATPMAFPAPIIVPPAAPAPIAPAPAAPAAPSESATATPGPAAIPPD